MNCVSKRIALFGPLGERVLHQSGSLAGQLGRGRVARPTLIDLYPGSAILSLE
jgi:hypothetical protein